MKKIGKTSTFFIFIIIGGIIGLFNFYVSILFLFAGIIFISACLLSIIWAYFFLKNKLRTFFLFNILIYLGILISSILMTLKIKDEAALFKAKNINDKIEKFENENGEYPINLDELGIRNSKVEYKYDSLTNNYFLIYDIDGYNAHVYNNKSNNWYYLD